MAYLSKSWPILGQPVRNSWAIPRELRSPAKQHGNWPGIDRGDGEGSDGMRFMPSLPMQFQGNCRQLLGNCQCRRGGWGGGHVVYGVFLISSRGAPGELSAIHGLVKTSGV